MKTITICIFQWSNIIRLLEGGNLLDKVSHSKKIFTEKEAAVLAKQVLSALDYCHLQNYAHRDIKPENIMYLNRKFDSPIKLIDFGFATKFQAKKQFTELMGSPIYMAPEVVIGKGYGEKCDIWSLGIIIYFILSGKFPYKMRNMAELIKQVSEAKFTIENFKDFRNLSEKGKLFILKMLTYDDNLRPSAQQLLEDPWLNSEIQEFEINEDDRNEIFSNILKYKVGFIKNLQSFQHAVFEYIALNIDYQEEIEKASNVFKKWDKSGDGRLTTNELKSGIKELKKIDISNEEIDNLFLKLDADKSGLIDYSEFLAFSLKEQCITKEENIKLAFNFFDKVIYKKESRWSNIY